MTGHAWIPYSAAELAFLEERKATPRQALYAAFVAEFGREDVSFESLRALMKRRGWLTGRTGCFEKGQAAHNKGKKMLYNAASAATQFKAGAPRAGRAAEVYKPIGTERVSEQGYIERKVHDGLPMQSRWRAVHLIRWEEAHGRVPGGHALKCLDGDRTNTDPSNWEPVPRGMLPRLSVSRGRDYDHAPDELKPMIMAVARLEHAVAERGKGGNT